MRVLKKVSRYSVSAVMLLSMFVMGIPVSGAYADDLNTSELIADEISNEIPQDATSYVEADLTSIQGVAQDYADNLGIDKDELNDVSIGTPYVIYDIDEADQNEIYHYPILNDSTDDVVMVVDVMGTTDGWTYDISTDMRDELNSVDYPDNPCIFYGSDDTVVADDADSHVTLCGTETDDISAFASESFSDKTEAISDCIDNLQATDTGASAFGVDGYSPSLSALSTGTGKKCDLYNEKGQGGYGLCWAATVATIVNYCKGTNYTAKNVANTMNVGYNAGASPEVSRSALQTYDCTAYDYLQESQLSWATIKKNIKDKKPFYASLKTDSGDGHGVTGYGYKTKNDVNYLVSWNSGLASGDGHTQIVKYKSSGTTLSYANDTYTWKRTVCAYHDSGVTYSVF